MGQKNIVKAISDSLRKSPKSISDLADDVGINWRTAENHLNILKFLGVVKEVKQGKKRIFLFRQENTYFRLPVRPTDEEKINSFYSKIKDFCNKFHEHDPTKTQAYKVLWKINKNLGLDLPIGWYRYGPCCVQVYQNDEKPGELSAKEKSLCRDLTREFCALDNIELQNRIYEEENRELYKLKQRLDCNPDRKTLNNIFFKMIKSVPDETVETVTDFARVTLFAGWDKTQHIFELLWKYIAMITYKESLKPYYGEFVKYYFDKDIESTKRETQLRITALFKSIQEKKSR